VPNFASGFQAAIVLNWFDERRAGEQSGVVSKGFDDSLKPPILSTLLKAEILSALSLCDSFPEPIIIVDPFRISI
jgi:hypothetical protein